MIKIIIEFVFQLIRSQPNRRICYNGNRLEVNETTNYNFDDMIPFNIQREYEGHYKKTLGVGLIDRNHLSNNNKFYSIKKDEFTEEMDCWGFKDECQFPKFMADIPNYWRNKLDAIIHLEDDWLILFNNNSKPVFCMASKSMSFTEAVRIHLKIVIKFIKNIN